MHDPGNMPGRWDVTLRSLVWVLGRGIKPHLRLLPGDLSCLHDLVQLKASRRRPEMRMAARVLDKRKPQGRMERGKLGQGPPYPCLENVAQGPLHGGSLEAGVMPL